MPVNYLSLFISLEGIEYLLGMLALLVLLNLSALIYFVRKRGLSGWLVSIFSGWLITSLLLQQLADYTYSDNWWYLSLIFWFAVLPVVLFIAFQTAALTKVLGIGLICSSLIMGCVNYQAYNNLLFYKKIMEHRPTMMNLHNWVYTEKVSNKDWEIFFKGNLTRENLEDAIELILRDYENAEANLLTTTFGRLTLKAWADYNDQHPEYPIDLKDGIMGELDGQDRLIVAAFTQPDFLIHCLDLAREDNRIHVLLNLIWQRVITTDPYWLGAGDEYTADEVIRLAPAIKHAQQSFTDFDERLTKMKQQADSVDALIVK